ncbi:glycosyltransferase [Congregibacter variabilis]|uniref:Glycosyltransferase n=1 Tax=Congregibacter variabilis TaxID=3081200 RepID=A0ABZ0I867_9GAMM|nr:glycosyltransferase [Congregibacter sp. IMCC43200]
MRISSAKIGYVTRSTSRNAGGLFTSVRETAKEINNKAAEVVVVGLNDPHTSSDRDAWLPLQPVIVDTVGPRIMGVAPGLTAVLEESSIDLLHQHGIWQLFSATVERWSKKNRKPVVISPRGMLDSWAIGHSKFRKRLAAYLYENTNLHSCACLHALNASEAHSFRQYGLKAPIAIIPNGIHAGIGTKPVDHGPRGESLEDKPMDVLFLGRIHEKKGLVPLLRAWQLVNTAKLTPEPAWRLTIAGWDDGGHLSTLQKLSERLGLRDSVRFYGPAFDRAKDALYASASIFVLPSYSEGLPVSVLEAWAYGKPVLMTRECNLQEAFSRRAAMEISHNPEDIATKLLMFMDQGLSNEYGDNGKALVEESYTWNSVGSKTAELYEWLLGGQPCPDFVYMPHESLPDAN